MADNETQTQTPPETPAVPDASVETLKAQKAALDRKISEQAASLQKYQNLLADKEFAASDLTAKHNAATSQLTALQAQLAETAAAATAEAAKSANLAKTVERQKLFMSDYTDLAALEAKGRLRVDLEGDAMREYLNGFREDLKSLGAANTQIALQGSTPSQTPPAAAAGQPNLEMLYAEFDKIMNYPILTETDRRRMAELESEIAKASK